MRPVNQLPLSLTAMKRSPLASNHRHADSPPKQGKREVSTSPLRYCSAPKRTREGSRGSKEAIGRALTSIETGAVTENSSGAARFGGACVASCARAMPGSATTESPAADDLRKRRRLRCGGSFLMVRRRACAVSNHEAAAPHPSRRGEDAAPHPSRRGEDAAPQDDGSVPRMLRSAKRCAADPGSIVHSASAWVPALRCIVQNAAPRPGHEMHCFTLSQDEAVAVRDRSSHCVTNAACAG